MTFVSPFRAPVSAPFPSQAAALAYILRDEFTTAESAPITSPRTCEPGPGALLIADSGNHLSISGGALVTNGRAALYDPRAYGNVSYARIAGRSMYVQINTPNVGQGVGWNVNTSAMEPDYGAIQYNGSVIQVRPPNLSIETGAAGTHYFCSVMRSSGFFILLKQSTGDWKLIWANASLTTTPLYPGLVLISNVSVSWDNFRVFDMSSPWATDYGIATNRVISPAVDETITSEANAIIEMTWTAVTGQDWELSTRRTDDDNRWIVRCSQSGSTIKLIERNAGIETERASAAQIWTNGQAYRLLVVQDGNTIKTYVSDVAKNSYASATFNNTATGVKTDRAGSNLIAWPRTLSGAALTELNRWIV